jgi:hypothetical protein
MPYLLESFNNVSQTIGFIVNADYGFMESDPYFALNTDVHFKCSRKMVDHIRSTYVASRIPAVVTFYLPVGGDPHAIRVEPASEGQLLEYVKWCREAKRQF